MKPEKLNYLIVLSEEKNFTRAAERLFISQPTLTGFINRLENNLDVKLFERRYPPVTLTEQGKLYLEKIQKIVRDEQNLIAMVKELSSPQKKIIIGIGHIHSEMWSSEITKHLVHKYPDLNIHFKEGKEDYLMEEFKNGNLDIFMGHTIVEPTKYLFKKIAIEPLLILISKDLLKDVNVNIGNHTINDPLSLSPTDIESLPIILPSSSQGLSLNYQYFFNVYNLKPERRVITSNMVVANQLVSEGIGYMYGSPNTLNLINKNKAENIIFATLPNLQSTRDYYLCYNKDNKNQEILEDIIHIIEETTTALDNL